MAEKKHTSEKKELNPLLPIDWHVPEHMKKDAASHFIVQHDEFEFTIAFFQLEKPIILGPQEQRDKILRDLKSVRANCVSRVVIAAPRMFSLLEALKSNLDKYLETSKEAQELIEKQEKSKENPK